MFSFTKTISLTILISFLHQVVTQGNITYTMPIAVADPGKSFSMNDINKFYQMLPLTT